MKQILSLLMLMVSTYVGAQEIKVIQINADWNLNNTRLDLDKLEGCSYQFGWLKHQSPTIQSGLSSVPVVLIYKGNKLVKKYEAGISLKLDIPFEDIQQTIYAIKED
jgi:hypothetical protein